MSGIGYPKDGSIEWWIHFTRYGDDLCIVKRVLRPSRKFRLTLAVPISGGQYVMNCKSRSGASDLLIVAGGGTAYMLNSFEEALAWLALRAERQPNMRKRMLRLRENAEAASIASRLLDPPFRVGVDIETWKSRRFVPSGPDKIQIRWLDNPPTFHIFDDLILLPRMGKRDGR